MYFLLLYFILCYLSPMHCLDLLVPRHRFSGAGDYSIQSCPSVCPSVCLAVRPSVRVSTLLSTSLYGLYLRNPSTDLILIFLEN